MQCLGFQDVAQGTHRFLPALPITIFFWRNSRRSPSTQPKAYIAWFTLRIPRIVISRTGAS
jgi:hypothetical protein